MSTEYEVPCWSGKRFFATPYRTLHFLSSLLQDEHCTVIVLVTPPRLNCTHVEKGLHSRALFPLLAWSQLSPAQMFKDDIFIGLLSLISPWGRGVLLAELDYECIIQFILINIL
jgi:hypothetical protein